MADDSIAETTEEDIREIIRDELQKQERSQGNGSEEMSRRTFLKMLGIGAGGLAFSSQTAAWFSVNNNVGSGGGGSTQTLSNVLGEGNDIDSHDIVDGSTTVWSSSNSHIPSDVVQTSGLNADQVDGSDAEELGGITYIQSSEPSSPSTGETWLDTSMGRLSIYADYGDGPQWHPIPPITVTDEAVTFEESDVSVQHTDTEVHDEGVRLQNNREVIANGESDTSPPSSKWSDWTLPGGGNLSVSTSAAYEGDGSVKFRYNDFSTSRSAYTTRTSSTNKNLSYALRVDAIPNSTCYFEAFNNGFNGDTTASLDIRPDGNVRVKYSSIFTITTGEWYYIDYSFDYENGEYDIVINGPDTYTGTHSMPTNTGGIDTFAIESGDNDVFVDAVAVGTDLPTGSAIVGWDTPVDVRSWGLATYQATPDGESVTVNVLDGDGNVLFADIGQNFDISTIAPGTNVQIEVELERDDTDNNPTLDYATRRFTR